MPELHDDLSDIPGILVGHDTNTEAGTGCTVILCPPNTLGAVDVRGGAPATRETDLLHPLAFMREVHAILLTGGSAFGLDAATGVMRALEARGIGFDTGVARVPIVPAAALFDLTLGRADVRPDAAAGERAVVAARTRPHRPGHRRRGHRRHRRQNGRPSPRRQRGVLGSASVRLPDGHILAALVATNAAGDIYDEDTGRIVAGARSPSGAGWLAADSLPLLARSQPRPSPPAPTPPSPLSPPIPHLLRQNSPNSLRWPRTALRERSAPSTLLWTATSSLPSPPPHRPIPRPRRPAGNSNSL